MKKIILLICFCFISSVSFSQLYFNENFNYPAGDTLNGVNGWVGFSSTVNPIKISSPGLSYAGYSLSGVGNAVKLDSTGQDAYKDFIGDSFIDSLNSSAAYLSCLVNVQAAKPFGAYVISMVDTGSTSLFRGRLYVKDSLGNVRFGIAKSAAADTSVNVWSPVNFSYNTTYLVVIKYGFVPGAPNDIVSLYVFSSGVPSTEPVPTLGPLTFTSSNAGKIGRVLLRQGENTRGPKITVDGIRVTNSWFPAIWNFKLAIQGIFDGTTGRHVRRDTVNIYVHNGTSPYAIVDSASAVIDSATLTGTYAFKNTPDGNYYFEVRYRNLPIFRNGINTWSKAGGEAITRVDGSYDFTTAATQAFGSNLRLIGTTYTIYNGDPVQNGVINLTDILAISNDVTTFATGYRNTDINGDNVTTLPDLIISFNNAASFVHQITPP